MLRCWPGRQVGPALPDQLQREVWSKTVDLGEVHTKDRMECRARVEGGCVRLMCPLPGRKQLARGWRRVLLQPLQDCLDLLVTGSHFRLVDVVEFDRLGQREDVLLAVVADQRLRYRLD